MTERTIENYRDKFRKAPVGCWHNAVGTFSNIMDTVWHFYPDGTGQYQEYGPFGSPSEEEVLFEWKECEDYVIWFRELNEGEAPDPWYKVRYDFVDVSTDVGTLVGMIEIDEDGVSRSGFGWSIRMFEDPLSYSGPADKQ